jgi:hypothetical protein
MGAIRKEIEVKYDEMCLGSTALAVQKRKR